MNKQLLQKLSGRAQVYKSIDTTCDINEAINYPTEFLNTLEPSGVPSHILELKIGAPIMLLRILHPPSLCNGTRLCIEKLMPNIIEAIILTGHAADENVFIPRIPIIPSDFPFQFKRLQFLVHLRGLFWYPRLSWETSLFPLLTCGKSDVSQPNRGYQNKPVSFAMSINKAQGQSLKVVGHELLKPCFSHGQLYVGCSTVGKAENLYSPKRKQQTLYILKLCKKDNICAANS
ncbi:hypothetical protein AVEN_161645-1 [Araneus ventricosus]|uniref:DNA helicase Pif1-like 2B domain-containing protein n=1 Tax=Araneus ventricosus TaxID=182803 RepID=A0A4Y2PQ05_ARAVE|nr:hypothetical protein AVEN_161645-1 [Araneus ventricosus]